MPSAAAAAKPSSMFSVLYLSVSLCLLGPSAFLRGLSLLPLSIFLSLFFHYYFPLFDLSVASFRSSTSAMNVRLEFIDTVRV